MNTIFEKSGLLLGIFFSLILLPFTSCRIKDTYTFLNSEDEIESICIIHLSFDEKDNFVEEELVRVLEIDKFIDDFKSMDCYARLNDPSGVIDNGASNVIKISYTNGEYEYINWYAQSEYTLERGLSYYHGLSVFDKEQFTDLLNKYLEITRE